MPNKQTLISKRAMANFVSCIMARSEKIIKGYRGQMKGLHRFKATATTGRVYKGCGREER